MATYFSKTLGANHAPNFLRASSPTGLRRLMLRNNARLKGFVNYMAPQYVEAEGQWYVWYFVTDEESAFNEAIQEAVE